MNDLILYNSLTGQKEVFTPLDDSHVTMYVCGPTVYDIPHIGNARPAVVFDVLYRLLREKYPRVSYARNMTDIDDKIIKVANDQNMSINDVTLGYAVDYTYQMSSLGVLDPTHVPYATEYIEEMKLNIERLINQNYAYVLDDGEVLFHVPSSKHQSFVGVDKRDAIHGVRIDTDERKKDPRDFVLWKPSKPNEPSWDSPWSKGRPGWHIECSSMIHSIFGQTVDIHAGGGDLKFPHHDAESAQSHSLTNAPLANYWMHNGMLTVNGKKMAKSDNNFVTVKEALDRYPGETIRFFLLKTHYRSPIDWSWDKIESAHRELNRLYRLLGDTEHTYPKPKETSWYSEIATILLNDLNTPLVITKMFQKLKDGKKAEVRQAASLLGIVELPMEYWFEMNMAGDTKSIQELVNKRDNARRNQNWGEADKIRDQLHKMNIELEDTDGVTIWRKM